MNSLAAIQVLLAMLAFTELNAGKVAALPKNFQECMRDSGSSDPDRLACKFAVTLEDKAAYDRCVNAGGIQLHADPAVKPAEYACTLTYHNPGFAFPKTFRECLDKGGIHTGDWRWRCLLVIFSYDAYNREESGRLVQRCIQAGGKPLKDGCSLELPQGWIERLFPFCSRHP